MLAKFVKQRGMLAQVRAFGAAHHHGVNLDTFNPKDIHSSSLKTVGSIMKALQNDHGNRQALCDEIDEFFRKNFRKVQFEDAKNVMIDLGFKVGDEHQAHDCNKIDGLDDKFWVWETLEEATRPNVDSLNAEDLLKFHTAWAVQMKGSEELHDLMHERIAFYYADGFPFQPKAVEPLPHDHGHHHGHH